jgi:hypothetical protein
MAPVVVGYLDLVGIEDLVAFLGERHVDRSELPRALESYVDDALEQGEVFEDCRDKLAALA